MKNNDVWAVGSSPVFRRFLVIKTHFISLYFDTNCNKVKSDKIYL
jgi:hypothetical protein